METKENDKSCGEKTGSAGNPHGGQDAGPAQAGNQVSQGVGKGNPGLQPGPVPGQTPFPYGYFQSPNLHPGYYMTQGGFPQGPMPGYWAPSGYGISAPYMHMQSGPAVPQGAGQVMRGDAPETAAGPGNAGYGPGGSAGGHDTLSGNCKESSHDELKHGTYMEKPGYGVPRHASEVAEDVSASSGLMSFFQFDNDCFWKGILVGSLATLLLTSPAVKKGIMKTILKASASVKGGVEELKEQLADVEAEVLHDLNKKKK